MNFSDLLTNKRLEKKQRLLKDVTEAKGYKKPQAECRLRIFNNKNYPTIFWNSFANGTYKRAKRKEE